MFSRNSRYKKLPELDTTDSKGRRLKSTSLRLLPEASGTFLHRIQDNDRLDHLACHYYKLPQKWWRICDANPDFLSPLALLGKEPIVTLQFPLTPHQAQPLWEKLLKKMSNIIGIENIQVVEQMRLIEQEGNRDNPIVEEHYDRAVVITYNEMVVTKALLMEAIKAGGFEPGQPKPLERLGKKIIIPPNIVG